MRGKARIVKSVVDIRTVEPGTLPQPPMLPSSVPSHTKSFVDQAAVRQSGQVPRGGAKHARRYPFA